MNSSYSIPYKVVPAEVYTFDSTQAARGALAGRRGVRFNTSASERALLLAAIVLLPLENILPTIAGISSSFIIFVLLAMYAVLNRPGVLSRTAVQPIFLAIYALLFVGLLVETLQPFSRYQDLIRIAQMTAGAVFIGTLCRDRKALSVSFIGFVLVGLWMSIMLVATSYGALNSATATGFDEASRVRMDLMGNNPLQANLNAMSFTTGQGVVVALALALMAASKARRYFLFAATGLCVVATFLPLSRSGIFITLAACGMVLLKYKGRKTRAIVGALVLGVCIVSWVPDIVFSRLSFTTKEVGGAQESRARVYTAAFIHFPEYAPLGVGAGNFWRAWGYNHGWRGGDSRSLGSHNCFIEITLYWGLLGLSGLLFVLVRAYRCLPGECFRDPLALALLGVSVSLLLVMTSSHTLYAKEFSIGLGLLAAARLHIWPDGICRPVA
jgi:hypothetical protein